MAGQPANDVDVTTQDIAGTQQKLIQVVKQFGLERTGERMKGSAHTITFRFGDHSLDVDLVHPDVVARVVSPPGVDCDVGNFTFSKDRGLALKVPKLGQHVSLAKAIKHAQTRKFVFFYNVSNVSYY